MIEALILLAVAILAAAIIVLGVVRQSVVDHRRVPRERIVRLITRFTAAMGRVSISANEAAANLRAMADGVVPVAGTSHHPADVWDDALEHAWELNDPAYTSIPGTHSTLPMLVRHDIDQAIEENPYRQEHR